jgi:hypothetical protein
VVEKVRHRLSVSKRAAQKFDMEIFNLKKLNYVEVKEQEEVRISNRFAFWKTRMMFLTVVVVMMM